MAFLAFEVRGRPSAADLQNGFHFSDFSAGCLMTAARGYDRAVPQIGSIALLLMLMTLCLLPFVLVGVMKTAVSNLHLPAPHWAGLIVLGIIIGGLINIPIKRYPRADLQPIARGAVFGLEGWRPSMELKDNSCGQRRRLHHPDIACSL